MLQPSEALFLILLNILLCRIRLAYSACNEIHVSLALS